MAVGRVKWFNDEKGGGFLKQDSGPDVFVHYSQIAGDGRRRLFEDELVEFEIKESPKGLQAINVSRMQGGGNQAAQTAGKACYKNERARAPERDAGFFV